MRRISKDYLIHHLFDYELGKGGEVTHAEVLNMLGGRDYGRSFLRNFSIFDEDDPDRAIAQSHLNGSSLLSDEEDRALGAMLGMAVGDALGHTFEFSPVTYDRPDPIDTIVGGGAFGLEPGQWTDDASMGITMADSLLEKGDFDAHDLLLRFLSWWSFGYNAAPRHGAVGLGGTISGSLSQYTRRRMPYTTAGSNKSSGNGSIMRLASVPIRYHEDEERGLEVANLQSRTTHQGDEAAECARLMTRIIIRAIHGDGTKESVLDDLSDFTSPERSVVCLARSEEEEPGNPDRNWNWKDPHYRFSPARSRLNPGYVGGYAMDGLAMALHCVYSTTNFNEAVLKAANMAGDSDTVGAICGQIAGAIYGSRMILPDMVEKIQRWDNGGDIAMRAYKLFHNRPARYTDGEGRQEEGGEEEEERGEGDAEAKDT